MKRLTVVLSILFSFAFLTTLTANAQQPQRGMMMRPDSMMRGPMQGQMQGQMMGGGMMQMMRGMHQQMMQNPMHRTSMMTFMLPAFADKLTDGGRIALAGLTEDDEPRMRSAIANHGFSIEREARENEWWAVILGKG